MVRRLHLLGVAIGLIAAVAVAGEAHAEAGTCTPSLQRAGLCTSGSSDGTGVDVVGTIHDGQSGGGGASASGPRGSGRALTDAELLALLDAICVGDSHCDLRAAAALNPLLVQGDPAAGGAGAPAAAITISDLARFLPASGALHAEPDGWAVIGVPANFWVDVRTITVRAALLGDAAEVRFTPQAYRFAYGDGSTKPTRTPGASWAALGQEELSDTPTGHVYRSRGDLRATASVVYSAQYRFADGPWIGVTGAVSASTPPERVLVVAERTALTRPG